MNMKTKSRFNHIMTAQEALERSSAASLLLGQTYGALQKELLTPLVNLTIKQLEEKNMISKHAQISPLNGNRQPNKPKFFVVNGKKDLYQLKGWLQTIKYNHYTEGQDVNGKPLIRLFWDYHLGKFPSPSRSKRGIVVINNKGLLKPSLLNALNSLAIECDYGQCWRKNELDVVLYGRDFGSGTQIRDAVEEYPKG